MLCCGTVHIMSVDVSGLYLSASSVMRGWESVSVVSPLFVAYLLTRVTGVPPLETAGAKRWGRDPAYRRYLTNTAVLIPFIY